MKSRTFLISAILLCAALCGNVSAQNNKNKKDAPKADRTEMMIKGMQNRLMLDDATSEKFSSVYKEYLQALKDCRKKEAKKKASTDSEIMDNIKAGFETQKKIAETKEKYFNKMKSFLNAKQLEIVFCKNNKCPRTAKMRKPKCQFGNNGRFFGCPNGPKKSCPNAAAGNCHKRPQVCPKASKGCPNASQTCPNAPQPASETSQL